MKTTSIRLKFRPSTVPDREGTLFFQFIHNREVKSLSTPYRLFFEEWNPKLEKVKLGISSPLREAYLQNLSEEITREYGAIRDKIQRLEFYNDFSLSAFVESYRTNNSCCMLSSFASEVGQPFLQAGRMRTARAYRDAARNFIRFNNNKDFALERLNPSIIKSYENYMLNKGNTLNTSSFYMRNLRVIHKNAVEQKLIKDPNEDLFAHVFTGVTKTKKRAVKKEVFEDLIALDFAVSVSINNKQKSTENNQKKNEILSWNSPGISLS